MDVPLLSHHFMYLSDVGFVVVSVGIIGAWIDCEVKRSVEVLLAKGIGWVGRSCRGLHGALLFGRSCRGCSSGRFEGGGTCRDGQNSECQKGQTILMVS